MSTEIDRPSTRHAARRLRAPLVVLAAMCALMGAACTSTPPSPPAGGGGLEIDFGPLTIPLPPIEIRPPATTIPFGLCNISYRPPGVNVVGATLTIPKVRIDPSLSVFTVPNIVVRIPKLRIPLSTITLRCGFLALPVQVDLLIPSTVVVKNGTLNLAARTITIQDPSFTVNGAGLGIPGLGDLVIPLPPIINIPLPTMAIPF
ncbi:MAG: hypothetical protein IT195_07195 [Microthrixaceae bacterium]|nr:hypothetical protein [Microthrixaceae bacterium]